MVAIEPLFLYAVIAYEYVSRFISLHGNGERNLQKTREGMGNICNVNRNIYVVDDDPLVRDSVVRMLTRRGFQAVAFDSATQFLNALPTLAPGCVLSDVRMPEMSGVELQQLLRTAPRFPVVLMTGNAEVRMAVDAIKNGAMDYVEKPFEPDFLCDVLNAALDVGRVSDVPSPSEALSRIALLSAREREVLTGIVRGSSNKEIARQLQLSPRTVESHRARVLAKMRARNTSELIRIGVAAGIG
jgi:two-component system response regulator FixJ